MSFPRTIYESATNCGQVIKAHITDEGIFRAFFNDVSGNMYCGLSRQSNYKQVIMNSSRNRTVFDVSNTVLNNFNKPIYGGTYHTEELSGNYVGFYVFQYNTNTTTGGTDQGPWVMFSEPRLQSYITQGDSSGNPSIYDTRGYSSILDTKNRTLDQAWNWANQLAYFYAISSDEQGKSYGMNEVAAGVPDLWDLHGQGPEALELLASRAPLNNNFINSNLTNPVTTNIYLDTAPYGGLGGNLIGNHDRFSNYYFASFSPKYVWIDTNNNATSNTDGAVDMIDNYYKGNFFLWVDTSGNSDTSGNVYLGRKRRAFTVDFSYNIIEKFKNNAIGVANTDISNVFVDLDADVSRNAINPNFSNIYSRPYFVACSDVSSSIVFGNAPYDASYNNTNDINIYNFNTPSSTIGAKYCKIKTYQSNSNDWSTTRWNIVYYDMNGGGSSNYLTIANGLYGNNYQNHYRYDVAANVNPGSGKYPSMDIDSNGRPHIAFFGPRGSNQNQGNLAIHYIAANGDAPSAVGNWSYTLIKDFGVSSINSLKGAYQDLSNNQPISLKISPYDDSVHIVYQDPKTTSCCVSYWTNSNNIIDISGIDSSLNYIGIQSYGKTIDASRASVEVYWDIEKSNCLFSRDFRRYNKTLNKLVGLTSPYLKPKAYINPLGGRLTNLSYVNKNAAGWKEPITFRLSEVDKIYIVIEAKLTTDIINTTNTLFCIGGGSGLVGGYTRYSNTIDTTTNPYFNNINDPSGSLFIGGGVSSAPTSFIRQDISGTNPIEDISSSQWYYDDKGIDQFTMPRVEINTLYRYEFYYNRTNYFASMKITNLDNLNDTRNGLYKGYNIYQNGGFNIQDGNISIGCGSHSGINPWNGEINKVSVYATDISNVPIFDLSRNGEILDDCSGTPFSSFFDNSGNIGLDIEPKVNTYQVLNTSNDMNIINNTLDISSSNISVDKPVVLHDIYYFQRVSDQSVSTDVTAPGQYITCIDRYNNLNNQGFYEMWAIGYRGTATVQTSPSVWTSGNGGQQWILEGNFPSETGRSLLDLKLFKDANGANWVFVCGENYLLKFTNDYNGNIPNGKALGSVWQTVNFDHIKFGSPQSGQSGSFVQELGQTGRWPDFCNMEISKINSTESQQLFGGGAPSSDEFHIWLGTSKYIKEYANTAEGTTVNISVSGSYSWLNEVYWTVFDSGGSVVQATSGNNSFTNQTFGSGPAGAPFSRTLWLSAGTYTVDMRDAYGDGWHGNSIVIRDMATNSVLGSGSPYGYGPTILTFTVTTSNTFGQYIEEYGYPGAATGYKDMVIRGNYVDFSNNTLDFSYNIITREIIDNSNNVTKNFNTESFNSAYFGGKYSANTAGLSYGIITTDSYVFITNNSGVSWDKRLGVDRVELAGTDGSGNVRGSMGSYIEENKVNDGTNNYIYDNSSIYIQTSTEPWNGLPGLTLSHNKSDYDLSFIPIDSLGLKTVTWDPSLNDSSNFWNPQVPDNNGIPVSYRSGGGNTIKTFIDNVGSNNVKYQYRQHVYTYDSMQPGDTNVTGLGLDYNKVANLYLKSSENDDVWQRLEFSVVDVSLNSFDRNLSMRWDSFTEYDISYGLINLPYIPEIDPIGYSGLYKVGKVPMQPFLTVQQPATNLYAALLTLNIVMTNNIITGPADFISRINFQELGIKAYFELKEDPENPLSQWELAVDPLGANPGVIYDLFLPQLTAGKKYIFRARLKNDYGYSWWSNTTTFIEIPSPQPSIQNVELTHSLFENKITWEPFKDSFNGIPNVQTVYSYDIEKLYLDLSSNGISYWVTDVSFTNFYKDVSGVLRDIDGWGPAGDLSGQQWTGPYDPLTGENDISSVDVVTLIDTDLSLNTQYLYKINCFSLTRDKQSTFDVARMVTSGIPTNPRFEYSVNDASLNILWTMPTDISTNTQVVWDVSWQEITSNGGTSNNGIQQLIDPYNGSGGSGKERKLTIPLTNNHLQADASYNIQFKGTYTRSNVITNYTPGAPLIQIVDYDPSGVMTYFNYQEPPVLNSVNYNSSLNNLEINWTSTTTPDTPVYYDISLSNVIAGREDVSYNITSINNSFVDADGTSYYPGTYDVRVRSAYGNQVPVDISLFSEWSNTITYNGIPEHKAINFSLSSYDEDDKLTRTDVSYVQLNWEPPGIDKYNIPNFHIPKNYSFSRTTTSKDYLYHNEYTQTNIPYTDISYNDVVHPISNPTNTKVPRIYEYTFNTNY